MGKTQGGDIGRLRRAYVFVLLLLWMNTNVTSYCTAESYFHWTQNSIFSFLFSSASLSKKLILIKHKDMRYNWWHFWFRSNFTTQKKKTHDFRFDVYTRKKLWRWFLVGRRGTSKQFTLNSVSIQIDNWFIFWFLCQTNILLIHFTNILDRNIGIFVDWQMVLHRLYSKANI